MGTGKWMMHGIKRRHRSLLIRAGAKVGVRDIQYIYNTDIVYTNYCIIGGRDRAAISEWQDIPPKRNKVDLYFFKSKDKAAHFGVGRR